MQPDSNIQPTAPITPDAPVIVTPITESVPVEVTVITPDAPVITEPVTPEPAVVVEAPIITEVPVAVVETPLPEPTPIVVVEAPIVIVPDPAPEASTSNVQPEEVPVVQAPIVTDAVSIPATVAEPVATVEPVAVVFPDAYDPFIQLNQPTAASTPAPELSVHEIETSIVHLIVTNALLSGFYVTVNNGGDEDEIERSNDAAEIIATLQATGEDYVYLYGNPTSDDQNDGWIRLVYGNSGWDVICDYSTVLEEFMIPVNSYANTFVEE